MKRAAFLDRDGVINRRPPEGQYLTRCEEMHFLPGVPEAVVLLTGAGFCVLALAAKEVWRRGC